MSNGFKIFSLIFLLGMLLPVSLGCGSGQTNPAGYPIDSDVQTTAQRIVTSGLTPSTPINLYDFSSYEAFGYGTWAFGAGLAYDKRLDIMPDGYTGTGVATLERMLTFFTISDIHITDKETPNQLLYLQRLWPISTMPIGASLCSGVMLYTTQLLDAAVQTINALHRNHPFDFGLSLGDTVNTAQYNETRWYIDVLDGKVINPSSGAHAGANSIDYQKPFQAAGLDRSIPWYQTMGNHDHFWMGSFPVDYSVRADLRQSYISDEVFATANIFTHGFAALANRDYYMGVVDGSTPYGDIVKFGSIEGFVTPPTVVADPDRRALRKPEWLKEFFNTASSPSGHGFNWNDAQNGFACYSFVPKSNIPIKIIVLDDTQADDDNSIDIHGHGYLDLARWNWLKEELAAGDANNQLMIIAANEPISVEVTSTGLDGEMGWWLTSQNAVTLQGLVSELQSHPNLLMWVAGHRHLNTVKAFISPDPVNHPENGFWQVEVSSLRDFPQQFRTFDINLNSDYSVSIVATDVDPAVRAGSPAAKSRMFAIGAWQITGADVFDNNPTGDPTIKAMPTGSYNAELVKKLSPTMIERMQTLFPSR